MPTLEDLLSRRDEAFDFPRIASVLQQVNMLLEWARTQKVVHRAVTPETLFVEPGSDRVAASFTISPLPLSGVPAAPADARTIAVLARAMLTRSPAAPERAGQPLVELRPGLPLIVAEETEALLQQSPTAVASIDVTAYIARIAMADALKSGEVHLAASQAAIVEQERLHREQIEQERRDHEQHIAAERKAHEERLAEERKTHEHVVAEQTAKFQKERDNFEGQLTKEHKALEREREALAKERAAHARDREALIAAREEHEREVTAVRERLEWESAALATQADLYAHTTELPTPPESLPAIPPPIAAAPDREAPRKTIRHGKAPDTRPRPNWSRMMPIAAVFLVALIGISALALNRSRTTMVTSPRAGVVDSSAGNVSAPAADTPGLPPDLVAGVVARAESTPPAANPPLLPRRSYFSLPAAPAATTPPRDSVPRIDTTFIAPRPAVTADSLARRDSAARARADSLRRDVARRDSVSTFRKDSNTVTRR
jgi:hypothetical protein